MDTDYGVSISFIESIFHSQHIYSSKKASNETVEKVRLKLKETCTEDAGVGVQKHYYNCTHVQLDALKGGDSYSFNLIVDKKFEDILYNTCPDCGIKIIAMLVKDFNLQAKARHDNLHPQTNLILQSLPPDNISNFVFSLFATLPSRSVKLLPNVLGMLEGVLNKNFEKDDFIQKTIDVFNGIKPFFTTRQVFFQVPKDLQILDEIANKWNPLVDYFRNKGDEKSATMIELDKIATKRFFLASSQPQSVHMGAVIMIKSSELNNEAFELAKKIDAQHVLSKIKFDMPLECQMASTYLVQSSLINQLLEFAFDIWKPLAHKTDNYENEAQACFAYAEAAIRIPYNVVVINRALELTKEGYEISVNKGIYNMQFMGLMKWSEIYGTRNDPKAMEYREKAIKLAENLKDEKLLMMAYHGAFIDYMKQNKLEDAVKYVTLFQEKAKKIGTPEQIKLLLESYQSKSNLYLKLGFPEKSAEALQEMLAYFKQLPPQVQQSSGEFYNQMDQLTKKMQKGLTTQSLKNIFTDMDGQLKSSLKFLESNTLPQLYMMAPTSIEYATNLMSAGRLKNMLKDYTGAIHYYTKALEIQQAYQNIPVIAECISELGKLQFKKKKIKDGINLIQNAIKVREEAGLQDLGYILDNTLLALALRKQKKVEEALEILQETSKIAIRYVESRGLETSRILYSGVISNTINFYCETAYIIAKQDPKRFKNLMIQCLKIVETYKNREIINRFQTDSKRVDCPRSEILFDKESELVEEIATMDYLKEVIKDKVKSQQMDEEESRDKKEKIERRIDKIKIEIDKIRAEIYLECLSPGQIPQPLDYDVLEETKKILPNQSKTGILEYLLIPQYDKEFMWSLLIGIEAEHFSKFSEIMGDTPEDDEFSEVEEYTIVSFFMDKENIEVDETTVKAKQFEDIKNGIIEAIDSTSDKELNKLSSELYKFLIPQKISDILKEGNYQNLTIVPDKLLHSIPWEILHDGESFFGLKYILSKSFSLDLFRISYNQTQRKIADDISTNIVFIGNPTLDLPGAEKEVKKIAQTLEESKLKNKIILREQANHESFVSDAVEAAPILHYAGHGIFLKSNPQLSYLQLNDYNLTANELSTLSMNNLVTILSACETGITRPIEGAEVLGLVRAFQLASTPSVIATNWRVSDDSASDLMIKFYEEFTKGSNIGESLRKARIHVYEKYEKKIIHWASYTIYGNPYYTLKKADDT